MEKLTECSLNEFTQKLAAKVSVPGGGGASALAGALAAALGGMVGSFTVGKPRYAAVEEEMQQLMARAAQAAEKLLDLVDQDAAAFEPLSRAYGLPKDAPGRNAILEDCLRDAAAVPLSIVRACCEVIELAEDFGEKGSVLMLSDAATSAALARGALMGAAMNVRVNTRLMKDRAYAEEIEKELKQRMEAYGPRAEAVFDKIFER